MEKYAFNFIEIALLHWYSSVNIPPIGSRTSFLEVLFKQVKNCLKYISIL